MLAQRLREIRLEHHLTQKNIADVLGVDRTTYTYYENGVTTPSPDTLYKLSKIYNVTVGCLMGVEENTVGRSEAAVGSRIALSSALLDPIASLSKDEKTLLMCYRVLPPEEKKKAVETLHEMALATESI